MFKLFLMVILLTVGIQGDNLKNKYEAYTEYLGMTVLDLNEEQLKKIIPKLEKKLSKDKDYKKVILQNKLHKLYRPKLEQTICFSQRDMGRGVSIPGLGDTVMLNGGKCKGSTLAEMNANGWKLIQVVGGLNSSFGMVFTR